MRRERALDCIDQRSQRGVEIGPLATPIALKADGEVIYVDHADAEALRHKYADDPHMRTRLHEIVEVDHVLPEGQSLAEGLASEGPFDYIIASHVIEHIPDIVGWLDEMHDLLAPAGIISLVVPDKRFTFDVNREPTDISAILDAHHRRATRPSFGQIYDFSSRTIHDVDPRKVWSGLEDYRGVVRSDCPDPESMAFHFAQQALASDEFIDIHCQVFTPASLLHILDRLGHLGLLQFEIASFHPTARDDLEFFVSLRALPGEEVEDMRSARQHRSVQSASSRLGEADVPLAERATELSDAERRLVALKRSALGAVRGAAAGVRARATR